MSDARAVLRLVGVRLDPDIPEHRAVHEAYVGIAPSARAEWLRFHLLRSVIDMGFKLKDKQHRPLPASVPRARVQHKGAVLLFGSPTPEKAGEI